MIKVFKCIGNKSNKMRIISSSCPEWIKRKYQRGVPADDQVQKTDVGVKSRKKMR